MKEKKITAIIPARKGSVRVKNKNIRPFAGSTLLEEKIKTLKRVGFIDRIIVSSDCEKMLDISEKSGVEIHRRDDYYASSEVTGSELFEYFADSIDFEYCMYSPVTSPLISVDTYKEVLRRFKEERSIMNLVTVSKVKQHLWLDGVPLNYKVDDSPNSQDLPDILSVTYGICITSRDDMKHFRNVVTDKPTFKVLDEVEAIDIDTPFEFEIAEYFYNKLRQDK